jgi:hypothetical protein
MLRKRSHDIFLMFGITSFRVGFFSITSSSIAYSKQALVCVRTFSTVDLRYPPSAILLRSSCSDVSVTARGGRFLRPV